MKNNYKKNILQIFLLGFVILLLFVSCDKQDRFLREEQSKENKIAFQQDNTRMKIIFIRESLSSGREWYGLRDTQTGREYLVVTHFANGGMGIIELKPKEGYKKEYEE